MCIIAAKASGVKMPDATIITTMWNTNSDGAGIMYTKNGKVVVDKGYMKLKPFKERLERLENEIDTTRESVVLHFRIKTHGTVSPECTHPFPITDSAGALKKLKVITDIGVVHNGIIYNHPRNGFSDTMEYIASQLAPLKRAVPTFYKNPDLMVMVDNAIDSKMCFLTGDRQLYFIGTFNENAGIKYSNYGYLPYSNKYTQAYFYTTKRIPILMNWLDTSKFYLANYNGGAFDEDILFDCNLVPYRFDWKSSVARKVYGKFMTHAGVEKQPEFDLENTESILTEVYEKQLTDEWCGMYE